MITNPSFLLRSFAVLTSLIAGVSLYAAPLTWFPGPPIRTAFSEGAAVADSSFGNIVIGGDTSLNPEYLVVTNPVWNFLPAFSGVHIAPGAVDIGDFIVVYGGNDGTASSSGVVGYSPSGDTAQDYPSMSVARSYLGYTADRNGSLYAIGGLDGTGQPLASAESLNTDSTPSSWSAIASMPMARYNFPAVFDRTNRIYICGGYTTVGGVETADLLAYSTSQNTWTKLASLPVAVAGSAAAFGADGKVYVVGGLSGGVATNLVQVYNPAANAWTVSTPLPESLSGAAMSVDSLGRLIVMGGMDTNGNDVSDVWRSQQLGTPDSAPVFTGFPATSGVYAGNYVSTIAASGNPEPVFVLVSGPTNMTVDYYSGAIAWTPQGADQIGSIPVTIAATNFAGSTNWAFAITVPPPPPYPPTNLVVVSATDNSLTLGWDPENPLVGPVAYKIYRVTATRGGPIYTLVTTSSNNVVTLTSLAMNSPYAFVVAVSTGTVTTRYSAELAARTTGPQAPTSASLIGVTSTTLTLKWTPSPGPAQSSNYSAIVSYSIMRWGSGLGIFAWIPEATGIPGNVTTGTVTGVAPGTLAEWSVQAFDSQGNGSSILDLLAVTNPVPVAAQISGATSSAAGFQFTASEGGSVLQTVLIQASTNPADSNSWSRIGSVFPSANPFTFTDTNSALYPTRFYRVVAQ